MTAVNENYRRSNDLTVEERATNFETMRHIQTVGHFLNGFIREFLNRAELHDRSKLDRPEVEAFTEHTPALAEQTYGGTEYNETPKKAGMAAALSHHYANNRHHPQHFKNGIEDMNLVDLVEMLCDWKAASMRQHDGNIRTSIEKNADRFKISPQLVKILENTVELFE